MSKESRLSNLKKVEFFRFKGRRKVYRFDGGGKTKGFAYTANRDISESYTTKSDRIVEIGFTF